jgi:hypothetical protein
MKDAMITHAVRPVRQVILRGSGFDFIQFPVRLKTVKPGPIGVPQYCFWIMHRERRGYRWALS